MCAYVELHNWLCSVSGFPLTTTSWMRRCAMTHAMDSRLIWTLQSCPTCTVCPLYLSWWCLSCLTLALYKKPISYFITKNINVRLDFSQVIHMSENNNSDWILQTLNCDAHLFSQRDRAFVIYNISLFWYFDDIRWQNPVRSRLILHSST